MLKFNSGEKFPLSINQVGPGNIFINAEEIQLSGRYSLANNHLTLIKSNQPRISGVKFIGKHNGSWAIVESPSTARTGYQLGGSSLTRIQQ